MAPRCSRFGCAFRQNQTGSSSSASKTDDSVTLATTGLQLPSSKKSSKYLTIFPAATARAIISSPLTIAYHRSLACLVAQASPSRIWECEDLPANHANARESQRKALSKTILISAVVKPPLLWPFIRVHSRHSRAKRFRLRRSRSGESAVKSLAAAERRWVIRGRPVLRLQLLKRDALAGSISSTAGK